MGGINFTVGMSLDTGLRQALLGAGMNGKDNRNWAAIESIAPRSSASFSWNRRSEGDAESVGEHCRAVPLLEPAVHRCRISGQGVKNGEENWIMTLPTR